MIVRDSKLFEDIQANGVSSELLADVLSVHQGKTERLLRLKNYYKGNQAINSRVLKGEGRPNNKLVHSYPKYITTMVTGYLLGDKIKYLSKKAGSELMAEFNRRYDISDFDAVDEELAKNISIYGVGCELMYMSPEEKPAALSASIDPLNAFVVYTDDISLRRMFGVYYYSHKTKGGETEYRIFVYTQSEVYEYTGQIISAGFDLIDVTPHYFKDIPLIEYYNNLEGSGDFEGVVPLIDAYDLLQSDRVNDVESTVNSILFLKNFSLAEKDASRLKKDRILQSTGGGDIDAKWLTNELNQSGVEVLRKNLEADIAKFSFVPNMSDENFANNVSGVAMKYKLIGLSQLIKIKKRYMEKGLRERLKMMLNLPNWTGEINREDITIEFTHSLPVNELEIVQVVKGLSDIVSRETLLGQVPFVKDIKAEAEAFEREKRGEGKSVKKDLA